MFSEMMMMEKKDACYYKVKSSAKVWPSAYASGRLVQCRKKGASNYGNKSEGVAEAGSPAQQAAIAIAMKKAGKKPKDLEESDAYDKDVKPSDKPHDKDAAAKRAVIAARAARKAMANRNEAKDISINATTKKITKGQTTKTGVAKWLGAPTEEKVPEYKTGGEKLAKKFDKAFKSLGIKSNVKIKTVNNISMNEIDEEKKDGKEATANDKKKSIKQGEKLSGKQEPITIDPELNQVK
jgi:hypothetical protein